MSLDLRRKIFHRKRVKHDFWLLQDFLFSIFSTGYRIIFEKLSIKNYAKKENVISSILSEFTVCFYVKRKDTNTTSLQCLYSYAEASSNHGNGISICLNSQPGSRIGITLDKAGAR